jgi:hypothetical protein
MQALITRLQRQQVSLRVAVAPSGVLAQLALLHAPAQEPLTLLSSGGTTDLLRQSPTATLTRLQFADQALIPSQALAQAARKLEGYGAQSLAHLARLDESALRRQFGRRLGAVLATVARGVDPLPFQPTPAPLQLHVRLRMATPLSSDDLLAGLAALALEIASALARRGLQAQRLELRLRWETGAEEHITHTVPQPIAGGRVIEATVRRMLMPVLQGATRRAPPRLIEGLRLGASHLTPRYPAQDSFWPQRARRLSAVYAVADLLAERYGKPQLLQSRFTTPDAIFEQERFRLAPLQADVADATSTNDTPGALSPGAPRPGVAETPATIPHSIHWW